jgi:hypothetical protein
LDRIFENEFQKAKELIGTIIEDLKCLKSVLEGSMISMNSTRELHSYVTESKVPPKWNNNEHSNLSTIEFVLDFKDHLEQLIEIDKETDLNSTKIVLSKLFDPKAYITATRQTSSKLTKISLENTKLCLSFEKPSSGVYFVIKGLKICGAKIEDQKLTLTENVEMNSMELGYITWVEDVVGNIRIPVYQDIGRESVLFYYDVTDERVDEFVKRSVAIIC